MWRNNTSKEVRGWVGPGLMVCVNSRASSIWVSMRGVLVKCNADCVRIATDEEWLGAEIIKVLSQDARNHLDKHGQRGYIDVTGEEGPGEEDLVPPSSPAAATGHSDLSTLAGDLVPEPMPMSNVAMTRQASTTAPPTSTTRTVSEAGTDVSDQRNVRARVDELDVDLNADPARLGVPVPHGGWIEAQRRQDANNGSEVIGRLSTPELVRM